MANTEQPSRTWTVLELLRTTETFFAERGIESPRLDAELLLAHAHQCKRIELYTQFDRPLSAEEVDRFRDLVRQRSKRKPVHYILGEREFYSRLFAVNENVLVPRPETEFLVDEVLKIVHASVDESASPDEEEFVEYDEPVMPTAEDDEPSDEPEVAEAESQTPVESAASPTYGHLSILDVGTGSGILAITLALELPECVVHAVDISPDALEVARSNAAAHNVEAHISFQESDLFSSLEESIIGTLDFIVSNPPYIKDEEHRTLMPEVRDYEPPIALRGGQDGLDFYRRLITAAPEWLEQGGWMILEVGDEQAGDVVEIARQQPDFGAMKTTRDYGGVERVVSLQKR